MTIAPNSINPLDLPSVPLQQRSQPPKLYAASRGGRVWSAAQRDAGKVIHWVATPPCNGFWGNAALCGIRPGSRGYGWAQESREATCQKCLKRAELRAKEEINNNR